MAVYLQFDSLARTDAYILRGGRWYPNDNYQNASDNPYQPIPGSVQTPSNYKVYYPELNVTNNKRTLSYLQHCKERPENITYSVELCMVTIPTSALVARYDGDTFVEYTSVLNEPYIYVRMMPIDNAEGLLISSNNTPTADSATFIAWIDRTQLGTQSPSPPITTITRPNAPFSNDTPTLSWIVYKSCMITTMRLKLDTQEWQIRLFDRYGNDIILAEADNAGAGYTTPPAVDPNLQTSFLVGIRPNYT